MIKQYLPILLLLTLLAACDKVTTPDLVGKWQLKTVEKNGTETAVDTVWYNFQSESVFMLQVYAPRQDTYVQLYGLKRQKDGILSIKLEDGGYAIHSDWQQSERSFTIDRLNRKKLTLRSEEGYRYSFIRF
jgi:hypothetical protein